MGKTSAIEWTDATWNPWQGCKKVSAGCKNCYMFRDMKRYGKDGGKIFRSARATFNMPLSGKVAPGSRIFTCSWSDFFIKEADEWRAEAWEIIKKTPQYFYIILTKRPENIAERLPADWDMGYTNVAILVSTEDQKTYNERWDILSKIPAAVRGISAEPMLGEIRLLVRNEAMPAWVITGGESGPGFREAKKAWFIDMLRQCLYYETPMFHKQNGGNTKVDGSWGGDVVSDEVRAKGVPQQIVQHMAEYARAP